MTVMKADESDEYLKNSLGFTNSKLFQHFEANSLHVSTNTSDTSHLARTNMAAFSDA